MPRDLAAMRRGNDEPKDKISRDMDKQDHLAEIKPYVQTLTISDVDSAIKLEDAAFPPEERATREKVIVPPSLHFVSLSPNPTRDYVSFTASETHCGPLGDTICIFLHFCSNHTCCLCDIITRSREIPASSCAIQSVTFELPESTLSNMQEL
jgi:hypothetical protein